MAVPRCYGQLELKMCFINFEALNYHRRQNITILELNGDLYYRDIFGLLRICRRSSSITYEKDKIHICKGSIWYLIDYIFLAFPYVVFGGYLFDMP
jgi:hypothetical protein